MNALNTLTFTTQRNESVIVCRLQGYVVAHAYKNIYEDTNTHWDVYTTKKEFIGNFSCKNDEAETFCVEMVREKIFDALTGLPEGMSEK